MPDDTGTITLTLGPIPDHTPIPDENDYYEVLVDRVRSVYQTRSVRVRAPNEHEAYCRVDEIVALEGADFWDAASEAEGDWDGYEFQDCKKLSVSEANE